MENLHYSTENRSRCVACVRPRPKGAFRVNGTFREAISLCLLIALGLSMIHHAAFVVYTQAGRLFSLSMRQRMGKSKQPLP